MKTKEETLKEMSEEHRSIFSRMDTWARSEMTEEGYLTILDKEAKELYWVGLTYNPKNNIPQSFTLKQEGHTIIWELPSQIIPEDIKRWVLDNWKPRD